MNSHNGPHGVASVVLEGFRVFGKRTAIDIGRLTLLAGANSSGKSSAMLGLLLLKQTLDAPFDPGPLLLTGGHVAIASFDQLRSRGARRPVVLGMTTTCKASLEITFNRDKRGAIAVVSTRSHGERGRTVTLNARGRWGGKPVGRNRFMLGRKRRNGVDAPQHASCVVDVLEHLLHLPGLRSPPQRDYPLTAVGETFEGRFDPYVASLIAEWQRAGDRRLQRIANDLEALGLTWKVRARRRSDTHVALEVGRLPAATRGGAHDVVEIADVGVGVSQALPVIVALHQAGKNQLVYVEQPELHLHPKAQRAMAHVLVAAAARGVRVVVETHSPLLLLEIQAEVARGVRGLASGDVLLHWFARDPKTGETGLTSRTLDSRGVFEDSPTDFDEVELAAHAEYLDAVEAAR